jgi:hypothetical protein
MSESQEKTELKKFPKVRPVGHPDTDELTEPGQIFVQEKMDGANFRFTREGDRILFGSRNVIYRNEKDIAKTFRHAVEHVRNTVDPSDLRDSVTYFGEAMHKHTLDYDWDNTPSVLGFAAYDHESGSFIRWTTAKAEFERIGLSTVPEVETLSNDELTSDYDIPQSEYYDGKAEGVVFWHENGTRAKLRSEAFKEKHDSPTSDPEDYEGHAVLVNKYCTDTRIDKRINDLLDEGHTLGRKLMGEGLPQAVSRDILEEEAHEIVAMNETVNLKDYRSLVAEKCLSRIDARLQERSVGGSDE